MTKVSTATKGYEALSSEVKKLLTGNPNSLNNEEKSTIEGKLAVLDEFLGNKSLEKIDGTNQALESIKNSPLYEKLKTDDEKRKNKNVIKIHSDTEFNDAMDKAKKENKGVVIDFFAVWCGPCVHISPFFADLSEKYPNVVFLKVDVDQTATIAQKYGVECMPTFKFISKAGEVVNTLEGADIETLEKHIKEL